MSTGDYCNRDVVVVDRSEAVRAAAHLMRRYHVGDLVVVDGRGGKRVPVGILTDRDLVVEIMATDVDPDAVTVGDAMSYELVSIDEDQPLEAAIALMRDKAVRRLPVVDREGALLGIIAVDDLIDVAAEQLTGLSRLIRREQAREMRHRV